MQYARKCRYIPFLPLTCSWVIGHWHYPLLPFNKNCNHQTVGVCFSQSLPWFTTITHNFTTFTELESPTTSSRESWHLRLFLRGFTGVSLQTNVICVCFPFFNWHKTGGLDWWYGVWICVTEFLLVIVLTFWGYRDHDMTPNPNNALLQRKSLKITHIFVYMRIVWFPKNG